MENIYCPLLFLESDDGNALQVKKRNFCSEWNGLSRLGNFGVDGGIEGAKGFTELLKMNFQELYFIVLSPTHYIAKVFFFLLKCSSIKVSKPT